MTKHANDHSWTTAEPRDKSEGEMDPSKPLPGAPKNFPDTDRGPTWPRGVPRYLPEHPGENVD